jgi:hypothetical protein
VIRQGTPLFDGYKIFFFFPYSDIKLINPPTTKEREGVKFEPPPLFVPVAMKQNSFCLLHPIQFQIKITLYFSELLPDNVSPSLAKVEWRLRFYGRP